MEREFGAIIFAPRSVFSLTGLLNERDLFFLAYTLNINTCPFLGLFAH